MGDADNSENYQLIELSFDSYEPSLSEQFVGEMIFDNEQCFWDQTDQTICATPQQILPDPCPKVEIKSVEEPTNITATTKPHAL